MTEWLEDAVVIEKCNLSVQANKVSTILTTEYIVDKFRNLLRLL